MMRVRAKLTAATTVAVAAAGMGAALAAIGPPLALAASSKKCPVVSTGGHKYTVSAISVSCSFADKWAKRLAKKRLKPHSVNVGVSGGPKGYTCRGGTKPRGSALHDVGPKVQVSGNCEKGVFGFPYFNWAVESKFG